MKNFHAQINRENPVLVEFFSKEDTHLEKMQEMLDELHEEKDFLNVVKVDVAQEPDVAKEYRVEKTPTFVMFHKGIEVFRDVQETSLNRLKHEADKYRLSHGATHRGSHNAHHAGRREEREQ
ncbi:MAG: thioredoxin family protein [Marinifilaceae bacterium]